MRWKPCGWNEAIPKPRPVTPFDARNPLAGSRHGMDLRSMMCSALHALDLVQARFDAVAARQNGLSGDVAPMLGQLFKKRPYQHSCGLEEKWPQ